MDNHHIRAGRERFPAFNDDRFDGCDAPLFGRHFVAINANDLDVSTCALGPGGDHRL